MPAVKIQDNGCRGCSLCVDLCPVRVFDMRPADRKAVVSREGACIGCLSCHYACPSQCVTVSDIPLLRPFHRIEEHAALLERFLEERPARTALTAEDWEEARRDVAARLVALAATVLETIGRGQKAVGRRAGALAAEHLPEMYEEAGLEKVLLAMRKRFRHAFDFDVTVLERNASLRFHPCGLCRVVKDAGETVGEAVLCQLFHEYWAGLVTAFVGETYRCDVPVAGTECRMELRPAG